MACALAAVVLAAQVKDSRADLALQAAIKKETVDGDLKGAIEQYGKIAQGKDRATAARALVRMGQCYEKMGDAEARKAYERVVREFGDQKDSAEAAGVRLAALGGVGKPAGPGMRVIPTAEGVTLFGPSPDGRYLMQRDKDGGLSLLDPRTRQARRLVAGPVGWATASLDGHQIAFVRSGEAVPELWIVGEDGKGERLLFKPEKGYEAPLGWMPDGRTIVAAIGQQGGPCRLAAIPVQGGPPSTLIEKKCGDLNDIEGGDLQSGTRRLVYSKRVRKDPPQDELWMLSLEDRSEALLYRAQSRAENPLWSPDGKTIAFLSDRRAPGAEMDLWLLRVSDGKPQGIPEMVRKALGPISGGYSGVYADGPITRNGAYYFHHRQQREDMKQLLTVKFDPDTGKAIGTPSFVSHGGLSRDPWFSRDGSWLQFLYMKEASPASLVIQSVDSGEEKPVPFNPKPVRLEWGQIFPDGRSLLISAVHPTQGRGIFRLDLASGAWEALPKPANVGNDGWSTGISPDGKIVILNRAMGEAGYDADTLNRVIAWNIETGQARELATGSGVSAMSYDGKQVAISRPEGKDLVIEVMPVTGGPKREIYRASGFNRACVEWEPDGRYLVFGPQAAPHVNAGGFAKAYMRIPVEGGQAQPIGISVPQDGDVKFPMFLGAVRFHPSGRQLVYVANGEGTRSEDAVLEDFLPGLKASK
jgi:Tol biopolymer transport system component